MIGSDVIWPAQFAESGFFLDLSDRFTEEMQAERLSAPVEANTWEGSPYAMPWYTDSGMLYYRRDLLEESGFDAPPRSWDELKEVARQVQEDSGTRHGFVFQGSQYEGGVVNGLEYIWSHGGEALDPDDPNRVVIDSPETVEALATYRSMIEEGISPESVSTFTEQEAQTTFLNGDSVFMRNWPYIYGLAGDATESRIEQDQIGVSALPSGPGGESASALGGWNFAINANSENPGAAWSFIQWMVEPEQQREIALETARIPTLESLLDDQEILDAVPVVALGKEAIERTRPRPVSPFYSDMSLRMSEQFTSVLRGETSPEEAARTLQEEMQDYIDQGEDL